jgi:hypothetical protein
LPVGSDSASPPRHAYGIVSLFYGAIVHQPLQSDGRSQEPKTKEERIPALEGHHETSGDPREDAMRHTAPNKNKATGRKELPGGLVPVSGPTGCASGHAQTRKGGRMTLRVSSIHTYAPRRSVSHVLRAHIIPTHIRYGKRRRIYRGRQSLSYRQGRTTNSCAQTHRREQPWHAIT